MADRAIMGREAISMSANQDDKVTTEDITSTVAGRVLTLRINRPEKRNALRRGMYDAIAVRLRQAGADDSIRVVLLLGSPRCFTAGNDLTDDDPIEGLDGPHGRFMRALMDFPKPIIAAPSGLAIGVGVTLLLHCDLVYAAAGTSFSVPFVTLATCPEFGSSYLLPKLLGHRRASAILLGGPPFDAATALEWGLVNEVLPADELEAFALARASAIAALPPASVRATKMLLKRASAGAVDDAVGIEFAHIMQLQRGAEAHEAVSAFREKRAADFSKFE